jgi:urease accessory protein
MTTSAATTITATSMRATTMNNALLQAVQVCDSTFPIGTFNHSFGMETYIHTGAIKRASDFEAWLDAFYDTQFLYGEGLATILVTRALAAGDAEKVWQADTILNASSIAFETRRAGRLIAVQMLNLLDKTHGHTELRDAYRARIDAGELAGNPGVAFAIFSHELGLDEKTCFQLYAYSVASTLVQNAVRAVPLGQSDGQVVLTDLVERMDTLYERAAACDFDMLGANVAGLELAQIEHETGICRLFMS